ncbi:MAG: hypothetical protein QW279_07070 [Candidatus Jordarchaeaceae archaeon]
MWFRTLFYLHQLNRNLRLSTSQLQEMQLKQLKAMVRHANEHVPFYHKKFRAAGIKPADIKSIADLSKLPITTKEEIQSADIKDIVAVDTDLSSVIQRITSGSTGFPLKVFVDRTTADFEDAVWARTFFENGVKVYEKMAVIADPRSFPKRKFFQYFGLMRRKYISIFEDVRRQFELLQEYKPQVIKGYPSSLCMLADFYNDKREAFKPRLIFTSAELLDLTSRKIINSAFQVDLLDNYACNEFGLLAWECHEHNGYHMNIDRAVIEFVNEGTPVDFGERGEIVCTSLFNKAMPLIRYNTGDVGVTLKEQCSCGRTLPLLKIVEGRKDDFLRATDGRLFPPTIFFPYPFESLKGIRQFRVVQSKIDKIDILLSVDQTFTDSAQVFEKARENIQKLFGNDMQVEFKILDNIPPDRSGKLRKVISNIN